ncbi:tektin-1 [Phlebotomus argentipes]|uniref:tektin-1 n=1 Tax=Phlebotomus argentipes TaxID=94469 RepID=UPI002892DE66|nr:tektin-1 [Phlebotomus argentipes]
MFPFRKFTHGEWKSNNHGKRIISEQQQELADRVISESDRLVDEIRLKTHQNHGESNHRLGERITDIKFLRDELERHKAEACAEEEALKTYRMRISRALAVFREKYLPIVSKCIAVRQERLQTDVVRDEVERELEKELRTTEESLEALQKAHLDTNEQIRKIRAAMYQVDKDIFLKASAQSIDEKCLEIKPSQLNLRVQKVNPEEETFATTMESWQRITLDTIQRTSQEINRGRTLRSFVDILLRQVAEDIFTRTEATNVAFKKRIAEVRATKDRLEDIHRETSRQVNEIERNLGKLEHELATKEGFLAACTTRLSERARRPASELCLDIPQETLLRELANLTLSCKQLTQMIADTKTTQRYLLNTQMQQEQEINVKMNSLKVDEVDCMSIRQGLEFQSF